MTGIARPRRDDHVDVLHGVEVRDPFRWLEDGEDPEVVAWQDAERERFRAFTDALPQRAPLAARLEALWRVDDERPPRPVLRGDRLFVYVRTPEQDKWVVYVQDHPGAPRRLALDPNTWAADASLAGFWPSPDGSVAIVGRAHAGDEDPEILLLHVDDGRLEPEPVAGWRRGSVVWSPDGDGFWFAGRPVAGSVPPGEEHYWHRVWFHRLGAPPETDVVVLADETVRERFHGVDVSEDGRWLTLGSFRFSTNTIAVEDRTTGERRVATDALDAQYEPQVVDGRLLVRTDWGAPRYRLMVGDPAAPDRESWEELVPEGRGTLQSVDAIGGRLYLTWSEDVATRVSVHDLDGTWLHDIDWPGRGTASVWGRWGRPEVWASFQSHDTPQSTYRYDPEARELHLVRASPIPMDTDGLEQRQVWCTSPDGTRVPLYVLSHPERRGDGPVPLLLTGYGGFNVPMMPAFSTVHALWAALGGAVAVVSLRGGGEFGRTWHEAGMGTGKQRVFDDFIAAAEHLVAEGWTTPEQLAISGGSNGGLLVAAATTQRPDLFRAVRCAVPLTDMLRFPRFGIAAIWTEEYGDPEEEEAFAALHAYSPYHRTRRGVAYPAVLVTGSVNDARTDPVHARKWYAAIVDADPEGAEGPRPKLLHIQEASGHHGAIELSLRADQVARDHGFLMDQVGLSVPEL